MSRKISAEHLSRPAYVYIRQSSMDQVRHNLESQRRQYQLAEKAKSMGWNEVRVIDEDLGRSGASAVDRTGFQRLVADVSLRRCGAVFSLEASRLARNNSDWYRLLDLCSLTKTLIVDSEAVYDPRLSNDRLLLGLKGAMSEAELGLIYQRAQQGILSKAKRGELYTSVAIGYVKTRDDRLEKDPNLRVQESIQGVFDKFIEAGSVRQTLLWYRQEKVRLPARTYNQWGSETVWKLPVYNTLLKFIKNPIYGGAYVWGRTQTETCVENGEARKYAGRRKPQEEWLVLIRDHHEGYIDWQRYEQNQKIVEENTQMRGAQVAGAIRSGKSLIAGLLRCGHCGRRLHVAYSGSKGQVPRYQCRGAAVNHGTGLCISFGGLRVDRAIENEILRVVTPAAVEGALLVASQSKNETGQRERLRERELEQLRYESERAYRQYNAVDPANRLVADSLERKWNTALEKQQAAEIRLKELQNQAANNVAPDRDALLQLAEVFPEVWKNPAMDMKTKKRIVRLLVEEIVASIDDSPPEIRLIIHWKGGKHTPLRVKKNKTGSHRFCTQKDVVELVRELARQVPDKEIVRILNRLGKKTGRGLSWNEARVRGLRNYHKIKVFSEEDRARGFCNLKQAAQILEISPMSVHRFIEKGILPARQTAPLAPWQIQTTDLSLKTVQKAVEDVKVRRRFRWVDRSDQLRLLDRCSKESVRIL
ncbi:MAG: recombinase family protein [Deltaproteobacteria bacterium]|nr:recombinase family protein [Deltaproteobacteria bacterium]